MKTTLERGSFGRYAQVDGKPVSDPDYTEAVLTLLPESQSALYRAAPDLLAALESAAESIEQLVKVGRIPANNAGLRDARAAIAKAKGEA